MNLGNATGRPVLVTGAGGFIGGHLAGELLERGAALRAVDCKPVEQWFQVHGEADNRVLDLSLREACAEASDGILDLYNLAADMGGMGFIEGNKAACMLSVLVNTHMLIAAQAARVERYFYSSSACVYTASAQACADVTALREEDAYPAEPEDGYGWEKLFSERMCRHYMEDFGLETRMARYHNVYGPHGTWTGGREKAPAAICRKVAEAVQTGSGEIEVWGDGKQTRSFCYVDDCVEGIYLVMRSDYPEPLNLGTEHMVTINELAQLIIKLSGKDDITLRHVDGPQGVRGRNSDNSRLREALGWEPAIDLETGLASTYRWIDKQVNG
jgi:GDP-D-mannose 3', 5'-epimerase